MSDMVQWWLANDFYNSSMKEMDFKESCLERAITYNGDWQIVFTTPCTYKFLGISVNT